MGCRGSLIPMPHFILTRKSSLGTSKSIIDALHVQIRAYSQEYREMVQIH